FHVTGVQTCALPIYEPVGVPFRVKISERTYVRDFMFQAGVAYRVDSLFNSDYHFTAGAIYGLGGNLNATFTRTFARTDFLDQIRSEERRVGKECGTR